MGVPATSSAMSPLSVRDVPQLAPNQAQSQAPSQDRRVLASAIASINQSELWPGRVLRIHFDLPTQSLTVQVVNSADNEILDQIPSEAVLRMASELGSSAHPPDGHDDTES
jgi:uncharacterized FlaG/YvyC family protein